MTSVERTASSLAAAMILSFALVACGATGSSSSATTRAKTTTTTTPAKTTTTAASTTTEAAGSSGTTQPSGSSSVISTPSTVTATGGGAFCQQIADSYNTGIASAVTGAKTPAALRKLVKSSERKSQQLLVDAPGKIRSDVRTVLGATTKFIEALDRVNYDISKLPPTASVAFSSAPVLAASARLQAFVTKRCGIDLGGSQTSRGSGGSGAATTIP